VTDYSDIKRPFCYFQDSWKAWHFEFKSLKEIAEEVLRARDDIASKFVRLSKQRIRRFEKRVSRFGDAVVSRFVSRAKKRLKRAGKRDRGEKKSTRTR
jgi:hypothetical protein